MFLLHGSEGLLTSSCWYLICSSFRPAGCEHEDPFLPPHCLKPPIITAVLGSHRGEQLKLIGGATAVGGWELPKAGSLQDSGWRVLAMGVMTDQFS